MISQYSNPLFSIDSINKLNLLFLLMKSLPNYDLQFSKILLSARTEELMQGAEFQGF